MTEMSDLTYEGKAEGKKINERIPGRIVPVTRCGRMGQLRDGNSDRIRMNREKNRNDRGYGWGRFVV